jgi:hypothetical protein
VKCDETKGLSVSVVMSAKYHDASCFICKRLLYVYADYQENINAIRLLKRVNAEGKIHCVPASLKVSVHSICMHSEL